MKDVATPPNSGVKSLTWTFGDALQSSGTGLPGIAEDDRATGSTSAGAIGVTALIVLYPKLSPTRIVGSDIAHAVPLTLLAGIGHWWLGDVNFGLVGALLLGSIPGVILGSLWSTRMPDRALRFAMAAVLLVVGVRLVA